MNALRPKKFTSIPKSYPNITFWILFFLLNAILFLPFYLVNRGGSTFWPSFGNEVGDGSIRWTFLKLFVIRQNADLFRLSVDWVVLVALWVWLPPFRQAFIRKAITVFFIFGVIYNTYSTLMFAFYNEYPNFYDDTLLLISGIEGLTRYIGIPYYMYAVVLFGIGLFCWVCAKLIQRITAVSLTQNLNRASHLLLALIVLYTLAMVGRYAEFMSHPRIVTGSITAKLYRNITQSSSTYQNRQLLLKVSDDLRSTYNYDSFDLEEKPDIFFIFVESYGDAIYQSDAMRLPYLERVQQIQANLEQAGWQTASIRSEAPIRGGKSWLAYTSFLFGIRVDDEAQYDVLLNEFSDGSYPHLGNYLKDQGYDYQRITPLLVTLERDAIAWDETRRFMGYDEWLFLNNMNNYAGPVYGWGPSPPDQYTLSFLREAAEQQRPDKPHAYFYITHNSHLPWADPPPLFEDWQTIADAPVQPPVSYDPSHESQEAYLNSMFYQLEMVSQVIQDGPDDALYVVVGDHQPPLRAFSNYEGTATPLHIISKNSDLINNLGNYDFTEGFVLESATLKHEAFYSLFMQVLLTTFADYGTNELPPILKDGLDLNGLANGIN